MAYRIYTSRNLADTCRDADDIHIEELGYRIELEDAKKLAYDYIKDRFFADNKDNKLYEHKDGSFSAFNFCSYGETIYIKPIDLK